MIGTIILIGAVTTQSPVGLTSTPNGSPEVRSMIARLGSSRFAERESAEAGLEKLGRLALPLLVEEREHRDLEIRSRVNALIAKIECSLLLEATPVTLDFINRPVGEVVAAIAARSDCPIGLLSSPPAEIRVTLQSASPVPFWSAIDQLSDSAGLSYGDDSGIISVGRDRRLSLRSEPATSGGLIDDHGAFRVVLSSLNSQRDLTFIGRSVGIQPMNRPGGFLPEIQPTISPEGRSIIEQSSIRLQILAEPRLSINQSGPVKLTTAVDNLGQTLIGPFMGKTGGPGFADRTSATTDSCALSLSVPLKRPERPGQVIRALSGTIPLKVTTRRTSPLVVGLIGAEGKTFRNSDATIVVHSLRLMNPDAGENSPTMLDISIEARPSVVIGTLPPPADLDSWTKGSDLSNLQVELANSSGRRLDWYVSASQADGERQRVTLVVSGANGHGRPSTLNYFPVVRSFVEIPFYFRDVPLP